MGIFEIVLIGVGLSMDAAAVSVSNGLSYPAMEKRLKILMPIFFGLFQGFMPVMGFFAGGMFAQLIQKYAGIVSLIILGFIGGKMIADGIRCDDLCGCEGKFGIKLLLCQSVATSIDAFAVGVSFAAEGANILEAAPIIAVTTFLCSIAAMILGKKIGESLGSKAQIFGGIVLVLIGIKAMF